MKSAWTDSLCPSVCGRFAGSLYYPHLCILAPVSPVLYMFTVSSLTSKGVTLSFFLQITSSHGAVLTSAASTSPVSLLQMHVLRPFPRSTDQRVGLEPSTLCIHKPSREFWCPLTFENCCFSQLSSPITFFSAFTQCKALGRKGIHSFAVHLFTQYL